MSNESDEIEDRSGPKEIVPCVKLGNVSPIFVQVNTQKVLTFH